MKILKKIMLITLTLIIVIFSLIPPKVVQAAITVETVGDAIASTAADFCNRYASESIYDWGVSGGYYNEAVGRVVPEFWGREQAYENKKTSGLANSSRYSNVPYTNKYAMDCVGFVSMIMHRATGLGGSSFTYFAQPTQYGSGNGICGGIEIVNSFENVYGNVQRGDIICWSGHVAIAVSSTEVIDCIPAGVARRPISNYNSYGGYKIVRIKESAVSKTNLNYVWYNGSNENPSNPSNPSNPGNPSSPGSSVPDSSSKYVINQNAFGDADKFYYNGMPLSGNYVGEDKSNWLIEALEDVTDWLVGVITLGYKIQIVGWTTIFQNKVTEIVELIVNQDANNAVTAETILFNQIQILDINFFNFDTAGGESISEGDLIYILRQNVASIYYSIRNIAIIVMLVVLIYVGIRMAISTVSGDKAKYKKMFVSWCVGFVIIMLIHYFMIVVINVNDQFVNFLSPAENQTVIYDEVRSYAYEIPASKGWTGTVIYVFLVYYMIKLLIFYFKRLLVVHLLAIMGPIMGLSYAIEMMKGKSKSFTMWLKEFAFNVLIQAIHVIIYSMFMNIIYGLMKHANIFNLIPYAIMMILILNLMMRSEKIIKTVFGLKSNAMKDVVDTVIQASESLTTAVAIVKPIYRFGKSKALKGYNYSIDKSVDNRYKHLENSADKVKESKLATDIQREIDRLKEQEKQQRKQYNANAMNLAKSISYGLIGMVQAVPMMYEGGPIEGTLGIINASSNLNNGLGSVKLPELDESRIDELLMKYNMSPVGGATSGSTTQGTTGSSTTRHIRTYNTEKNKTYSVGKGIAGFALSSATARNSTRARNIIKDGLEEQEKLSNPYQTSRIELLYKLQSKVLEEEERLNSAVDELKKNGFPPVFYSPQENENSTTIALNMSLKKQYSEQLEINLRQAMEGKPSVEKSVVNEHITDYAINNGHTPINLKELQQVLDEIADEKDYDVGKDFEENVRNTVQRNIVNMAEGKESTISKDAVKSEIIRKVEVALNNNNWDENTSQGEIEKVVTKDVAEEVIEKLSAGELTSIITSAMNAKGSLKKKPVMPEFEKVVESAGKVADINNDIEELAGEKIYDTEELIKSILDRDILD